MVRIDPGLEQDLTGDSGNREAVTRSKSRNAYPGLNVMGLAAGLSSPLRFLAATAVLERERWPLWLPPLFGIGAAVYLVLPFEPPGFVVLGPVLGGLAIVSWFLRGRALIVGALIVLLALLAGFVAVDLRSDWVSAPRIEKQMVLRDLIGRVVVREGTGNGLRVVLSDLSAPRLSAEETPRRLRIKLRRDDGAIPGTVLLDQSESRHTGVRVGDWIKVTARVGPPPVPAYPGAFDFSRTAWFRELGGVGFALSRISHVEARRSDRATELFWGIVEDARLRLAQTFTQAAEYGLWTNGATGGVATALVTGDRGGVPEPVKEDLRISGLAHLLAISGLHIGLAAGAVFIVLRAGLATWQRVALRYPIKKWSAVAAIFAAFGYLLLSGGTVPTQRAFIMVSLVMIAVLMDRRAVSMRLIAVAASVVLLIAPEQALSAGFQMSFAAVAALVALFEKTDPVREGLLTEEGPLGALGEWPRRVLLYVAILSLTTVVASAATAPFALYHFGRVANFGLLANLLAVPIMAFWVMPMGLLTVLITPIGLGTFPAIAMGWGIEAILAIAGEIAHWPHAATEAGAMPDWGLAIAVGGGLWLVIWRQRWRFFGLPLVVLGLLSPLTLSPPDIIVSETGRVTALRWGDGLWLSSTRREKFAAGVWAEKTGLPILGDWKALSAVENTPIRCDPLGCVVRVPGRRLAFSTSPRGLSEDCRMAEIVIATDHDAAGTCKGRSFIGPKERYRQGAHSVRLTEPIPPHGPQSGDLVVIETVGALRGERAWTAQGPGSR